MLLQTNSYIVPKEKRAEHSRLIRRFRQTLLRLGCDHFEVYEQVGSNWSNSESAGRYVQILRFLDRKHQLAVQAAERTDPTAQAVIADFCELINFPYQQQQGLFAVGFYTSVLPVAPKRGARGELVSTVEHEVIDDPEAEKPYPGSSDGPPLEEGSTAEIAEPLPTDLASEQTETVGELLPEENIEEKVDQPAGSDPEMIVEASVSEPQQEVVEPVHFDEIAEIPEAEPAAHSEEAFMKLVGGELDDNFEDEDSVGFIETEFIDEAENDPHVNGVHPGGELVDELADHEAEPLETRKSKDRPPGW